MSDLASAAQLTILTVALAGLSLVILGSDLLTALREAASRRYRDDRWET